MFVQDFYGQGNLQNTNFSIYYYWRGKLCNISLYSLDTPESTLRCLLKM